MAVTIKKKALTITSLLTRLFDAEDLTLASTGLLNKAQELEATGHLLEVTPTKFGITTPEANLLFQVPLKNETVTLAMKKKVGHTVKVIIKEKVAELISKAHDKFANVTVSFAAPKPTAIECYDAVMQKYHANGGGNKVAAIKEFRNLMGNNLKEAKDQVEAWIDAEEVAAGEMPIADHDVHEDIKATHTEETKLQSQIVYPVELDLKATPVLLKEAQKLNQPVRGTSGGSIYHVIAIGQDCVVAARIRANNEIAIRAEIVDPKSTGGHKAKSGLLFAGLELKNGGHFSLHLEPEDFAMVKRSIGSTIMAMSIPFWGVSTDLHVLQGVGK